MPRGVVAAAPTWETAALTIASTRSPITSSITAAPRMTFASLDPDAPKSFRTRALTPMLVAEIAADRKR